MTVGKSFLWGALILFLVCTFPIFSQQSADSEIVLTEEEAVRRALENNYEILLAENDQALKRILQQSAWSALYPQISAGAGLSYNPEIIPGASSSNLGINGELRMSWSFVASSIPTILKARRGSEGSALAYEDARRKVEREVRKLFLDILFQRDSIRLSEAQLVLAEDRYEQARISYENGTTDEFTFLGVQLEVENLKYNIRAQEATFIQLLFMLRLLLGIDQETSIVLQGALDPDKYNTTAVTQASVNLYQRLDVQQLTTSLEQSRLDKKIQQLNLAPRLTLGYSFTPQFQADPASASWIDGAHWIGTQGMFTLTLTQDLGVFIPRSSGLSAIKSADLAISALQTQIGSTVTAAESTIINLRNDIETGRESLRRLEFTLSLAARKRDLAEDAFDAGTQTFDDLRTAELEYRTAEQNLLEQKLQILKYVIDLAYELNIPFSELEG